MDETSDQESLAADVAETHCGIVFFAGEHAHKFKKPVRFEFVDFSTAEKRKAALVRELDLNRRISPEAYIDVVDLVGSDGTSVDHMLIMKRMPRNAPCRAWYRVELMSGTALRQSHGGLPNSTLRQPLLQRSPRLPHRRH